MTSSKNIINLCFIVITGLSLFSFGISVYSYDVEPADGGGSFGCGTTCHSVSLIPGDTAQLFAPTQAEAGSNINVTLNITLSQGGIIHPILFDANSSTNETLKQSSDWNVVLDPNGGQEATINDSVVTNQPTNYTWQVKALGAGTLALGARVYIPGPKFVDAQVVYVLFTTTDTTPPVINITSPNNGTTVSNSVTVSANITDNEAINLVKFELNDSEISHVSKGNDTFEATIDTTSYTNGPYAIKITAKDSANEVSKILILIFENEEVSADAVAHKVTGIQAPIIGDGKISETWENVNTTSAEEFGSGGYTKFLHDGIYFYALFAFQEDISWVAIWFHAELEEECMDTGDDGWVFGEGQSTAYSGDVYYIGLANPIVLERNDVSFETYIDDETGLKMIEIKRLLNTTDTEGKDIVLQLNTIYNFMLASNKFHKGVSGSYSLVLVSTPPSGEQPTTSTTSTISPEEQRAIRQTTMLVLGSVGTIVIVAFVGAIILFDRRGRK